MRGPSKKPATLKAISGTLRADRLPEHTIDLPLVEEAPPAPDWLPNAHAVNEWHRLAGILLVNKLLTEAALSTLGHLCALHGNIVQLHAAGVPVTASMVGTYRTLANDFGLTPAAQGKVRPQGDDKPTNKFAANGKRDA